MEEIKLIISPKTKVLQLIEAYPQLEDVLIAYVPAFKKLKNPILRKTVAKVATLQQAAKIGNVEVGELINQLRKEVGQELISLTDDSTYNITQPAWYKKELVKHTININEMLDAGEQPVNQVLSDLHKLPSNEIYQVESPFLPAPLLDKAMSLEIEHWVVEEAKDKFIVYFYKA